MNESKAMTDDIIWRLRERIGVPGRFGYSPDCQLLADAANEIERLRSSAPQGDGRAPEPQIIARAADAMAERVMYAAAPPSVALEAELEDAAEWCAVRRAEIGAVDGYDCRSGEEFGLRRAEIELRRRAKAALTRPQPGGAVAGTERGEG
jgi:hypothetical protein